MTTLKTRIRKMKSKARKRHYKPRLSKYKPGDLCEITQEDRRSAAHPGAPQTFLECGDRVLVIEKENDFGFLGILLRTQTKVFLWTEKDPSGGWDSYIKRIVTAKKEKAVV